MLTSLIRRFSRVSSAKPRLNDFQNIVHVNEDVRFYKRNNNLPNVEFSIYNSNNMETPNSSSTTRNEFIEGTKNIKRDVSEYNFNVEPDEYSEFDKFESLRSNPKYQDLTHEERQYLQELEVRSKLNDPFNKLNANKVKVDPVRDAKALLKDSALEESPRDYTSQIEFIGENEETNLIDKRLVEQNKFDEVVSRIRNKIRIEKKQNSEINKLRIPNVNGIVVDPIKKHVLRRAARIGTMLHTHIEQLFTCNDPEFLYKYLNGASISINHVVMPTSKSTVICYYNILSKHDPKQVQRSLDLVAPRVRFLIARKLELGYTPPVRFIKYNKNEFVNVKRRAQMLEAAFNLTLEGTKDYDSSNLIEGATEDDVEDKIVIRDDQITNEMNKEIQDSFHRRYCGYP
ncbi:uncharacterized protein TOT_030000424 [Theileria orientalis strain Shintoku]|uniref:Ribosome-binding factor A n=1 Tax=Theileria orientalis strain Shintoku TaxID=869250 RepID=J4C3W8_THEOR|nr:uncharacterized protein TOT_030000424 [Theileria orientalis strain Shintoku]BAM41161.1 uncharacterized protein TOT_030000424 [Theileria orientalis strain Shintoku]|eukprot:XP_009691462.1 uncharacterized protein TOT_030000424 [Theileria orientalis strain Shintoku]